MSYGGMFGRIFFVLERYILIIIMSYSLLLLLLFFFMEIFTGGFFFIQFTLIHLNYRKLPKTNKNYLKIVVRIMRLYYVKLLILIPPSKKRKTIVFIVYLIIIWVTLNMSAICRYPIFFDQLNLII